jgi:rhodanese-related sulfurtransferase
METMQNITVRQAWALLADKALLVDVREACACKQLAFGIENQISIEQLIRQESESLPSRDTLILANLDGSGKEHLKTYVNALTNHTVYWLAGGLLQWRHEGFPVKGTLIDRLNEHGENSCQCFSCCGN